MFGHLKRITSSDSVHKCTLPPEENIIVRYICGGYLVTFRRMFKKYSMISETNPRSKMYLKSTFNIQREKIRHLNEHYHMIHPFSAFKCHWMFFMVIVVVFLLVLAPILLCKEKISAGPAYFRIVLDAVCLIDIIIVFNTGYLDPQTKRIIMERKKVGVNYLKTWFTADVLALGSVDFLVVWMDVGNMWWLRLFYLPKILRIFTLIIYLNRLREFYQISFFKFKIFKLLLIMLLMFLWASCGLYILAKKSHEAWLKDPQNPDNLWLNLMLCFIEIFHFLLLLDHYPPKSLKIIGVEMSALAMGVVFQMFFLSQIMQNIQQRKTSENRYNEKKQQIRNYMIKKQAPASLMKRSENYFDFKFHKSYYEETKIVQALSTSLRDEINYHVCQSLLENVRLLKGLPMSIAMHLTSLMNEEIYLPNDVIGRTGDIGNSLYFISTGAVAVYSPGGKEICHIEHGGNFGEVCLTTEHSSMITTVVAVDYCHLYVLSRTDFMKAVETQPELYETAEEIAQSRMRRVMFEQHGRNRPLEFYDLKTPEGVNYFKQSLYEL